MKTGKYVAMSPATQATLARLKSYYGTEKETIAVALDRLATHIHKEKMMIPEKTDQEHQDALEWDQWHESGQYAKYLDQQDEEYIAHVIEEAERDE
jgi:hypothetical protein